MKKLHQDGFHVIELVVVLVVLGIVGAAGYRVMSAHKNTSNTYSGSSNSSNAQGNKADASGLVAAKELECLPRGHDNYRTDNTLAVDPKDANTIYVGVEYKGVFKSTDAGATWKQSDYGIRGYPKEGDPKQKCIQELGRTLIDPTDSQHVLISRVESPGDLTTLFSENAGIWESTDAGATWHQLVKPGMNASGSRAIAFDPQNPKTIYYGTNNDTPSFTDGSGGKAINKYYNKTGILYRTTDSGKAWTELPTGADHGFRAVNVAVDSKNPKTIWLFTFTSDGNGFPDNKQKGPMKSTDGGQTWTSYAAAFPSGYRVPVDGVVNPRDATNAIVPTQTMNGQQKSFVTTDGGKTWTASNVYISVAGYDTTDTSGKRVLGYTPYENNGGGIYESTDGGQTWARYANLPPEVNNSDQLGVRVEGFAFSPTKGTIYMSGSDANVWKSIDNGKTWKSVFTINTAGGPNKNKDGNTKSREQDPGAH